MVVRCMSSSTLSSDWMSRCEAADDPVWREFLGRLRDERCNAADRALVGSLNLQAEGFVADGLEKDEWQDAVLVTPRHAVRRLWNAAALREYCRANGQRLHKCRPFSTIDGEKLTLRQEFGLVAENTKKGSRGSQKNLDETLELAVGMKIMMTFNVQTEIELANGARGEVVDMVLHADEPEVSPDSREVRLTYPPAYVLVRFGIDHSKETGLDTLHLPGLEQGVVPITPHTFSQTMTVDGQRRTVKRQQLPLTAAYAFTDY